MFLRKEDKRNIKRDTRIIGAAIYINLMSLDRLESLNGAGLPTDKAVNQLPTSCVIRIRLRVWYDVEVHGKYIQCAQRYLVK